MRLLLPSANHPHPTSAHTSPCTPHPSPHPPACHSSPLTLLRHSASSPCPAESPSCSARSPSPSLHYFPPPRPKHHSLPVLITPVLLPRKVHSVLLPSVWCGCRFVSSAALLPCHAGLECSAGVVGFNLTIGVLTWTWTRGGALLSGGRLASPPCGHLHRARQVTLLEPALQLLRAAPLGAIATSLSPPSPQAPWNLASPSHLDGGHIPWRHRQRGILHIKSYHYKLAEVPKPNTLRVQFDIPFLRGLT